MGGEELRLGFGSEGGVRRRKKGGPSVLGMLSESRQAAWRNSVAPEHVARLTRPRLTWRPAVRSHATRLGATK
jgi:hypothetical protein